MVGFEFLVFLVELLDFFVAVFHDGVFYLQILDTLLYLPELRQDFEGVQPLLHGSLV